MAAAKKTSTPATKEVANWDDELAKFAKDESALEPLSTAKTISTKGGTFMLDGADVGTTIDVVILDWVFENHIYGEAYDENKPASPICYAFGKVEQDLKPHHESETPQCGQCGTAGKPGCCQANEWKSGMGNGKACKNLRRLAVMLAADFFAGPAAIAQAEVRLLKTNPSSNENWKSYVSSLKAELGRPTFGVVSQISVGPIPKKSGHRLNFAVVETGDKGEALLPMFSGASMQAIMDKRAKLGDFLTQPYPKAEELASRAAEKLPANGGKSAAKFKPKGVAPKAGKFQPKR